ncbi:hypothetical protein Plhal304r1_c011g0042431 [Plasmopara halstedii]
MLNFGLKLNDIVMAKLIFGTEIDHERISAAVMIKQTYKIDDVVERFGQKCAENINISCAFDLALLTSRSSSTYS